MRVPGRAGAHQIEVRIIQRSGDAKEIGEQQVAVDQSVQSLVPHRLLQRLERLTSQCEQLAPSPAAHGAGRGARSVALRSSGYVEGGGRPAVRFHLEVARN